MEQAAALGVFGALQKMTATFRGVLPIFILLSLIAGVWLYFLLVARHEPTDHSLGEALRAFLRFESMCWPLVGRVLYLSLSVFLLLCGMLTMVAVNFFGGLVGTVVLLLVVRILFEMALVLFTLHERLLRLEDASFAEKGEHVVADSHARRHIASMFGGTNLRILGKSRQAESMARKDGLRIRQVSGEGKGGAAPRSSTAPDAPDEVESLHE